MILSMTGFGRSVRDSANGKVIVEVQSVNRKYLEVFVSLPKEWTRFENEVRTFVSQQVLRGQISVRIHFSPNQAVLQQLLPDPDQLRALKKGWEFLAENVGYDKKSIDFSFLIQRLAMEPKNHFEKEEDFEPIEKGLSEALTHLTEMKQKEGAALSHDILQRLQGLARSLKEIEGLSPDATAKMRKRLKERMEEIFQPGAELDDRLMREIALFAERVDISEEITRLHSHLVQYKELLGSSAKGSGRKMDFLVQEMGREINTIGSKSMDAKIAHLVVDMKSELEKIREQIQNIE
jgi:uncharacterized protein (TIGR00255 family)